MNLLKCKINQKSKSSISSFHASRYRMEPNLNSIKHEWDLVENMRHTYKNLLSKFRNCRSNRYKMKIFTDHSPFYLAQILITNIWQSGNVP